MKHKLQEARDYLVERFPELLPEEIGDCIDCIRSCFISKVLENNGDIDVLTDVRSINLVDVDQGNLISLILTMSNEAREHSRGAVTLARAYISQTDYDTMLKELDINSSTKMMIGSVEIRPCDELTTRLYYHAFGVCRAKFKLVSPELMVIAGIINNRSRDA